MTNQSIQPFGNNDGTRASFAKFFDVFAKFFDVSGPVRTCFYAFGYIRIHSDAFCKKKSSKKTLKKKRFFFDKKIAKFSRSYRKFFDVFVASETCWDLFGPTRMHSDTFGYVGKRSEAFGRFRNFSDFFRFFSRLCQIPAKPMTKCVPPHVPTAPKISEMCSLKPFSCLLLLLLLYPKKPKPASLVIKSHEKSDEK